MSESVTVRRLREEVGESIIQVQNPDGMDTVTLGRKALLKAATLLKQDAELAYEFLIDLTAVDFRGRRPRFEVVYHFYSLKHQHRVRLKVPMGGDSPEVETLSELWPGANWLEREVWDMFGIRFAGHPDLRRLLMYEQFEGHPLCKDYPFDKRQPLVGRSE